MKKIEYRNDWGAHIYTLNGIRLERAKHRRLKFCFPDGDIMSMPIDWEEEYEEVCEQGRGSYTVRSWVPYITVRTHGLSCKVDIKGLEAEFET